jgi:hypothetical protein
VKGCWLNSSQANFRAAIRPIGGIIIITSLCCEPHSFCNAMSEVLPVPPVAVVSEIYRQQLSYRLEETDRAKVNAKCSQISRKITSACSQIRRGNAFAGVLLPCYATSARQPGSLIKLRTSILCHVRYIYVMESLPRHADVQHPQKDSSNSSSHEVQAHPA